MSSTLAVSHVFVVSENMKIVDFGEYYPSKNPKLIFTTLDDKIPITDIFSCSNRNGDCIIFGEVRDISPPIGKNETSLVIIDPYRTDRAADRITKESEVQSKLLARGARYVESSEGEETTERIKRLREQLKIKEELRPNPIKERMKQVKL